MKNIEAKISSFSADGYFLCIWYVFTPGYENIPPFRLYFAVTLNRCLQIMHNTKREISHRPLSWDIRICPLNVQKHIKRNDFGALKI